MSTLAQAVLRGLHSARPTDNNTGTVGRLYYETDTTTLFRDNGSGWDSIEGAGTGTIGGATGSTDNAVIRADGTGGATVQSSLVTVDDSGGINIPAGQSYNVDGSPHTHAGGGGTDVLGVQVFS